MALPIYRWVLLYCYLATAAPSTIDHAYVTILCMYNLYGILMEQSESCTSRIVLCGMCGDGDNQEAWRPIEGTPAQGNLVGSLQPLLKKASASKHGSLNTKEGLLFSSTRTSLRLSFNLPSFETDVYVLNLFRWLIGAGIGVRVLLRRRLCLLRHYPHAAWGSLRPSTEWQMMQQRNTRLQYWSTRMVTHGKYHLAV